MHRRLGFHIARAVGLFKAPAAAAARLRRACVTAVVVSILAAYLPEFEPTNAFAAIRIRVGGVAAEPSATPSPAPAPEPTATSAGSSAMPPAAGATPPTLPSRLLVRISGDPASPEFITARVDEAVADAVRRSGVASPPAIMPLLPQPQPLASGFLTSYLVPLRIASPDGTAYPAGAITVDVVNTGATPFSPVDLAFTDDPERIVANGVISRTIVDARTATRLYYYHENTGERRRFCVVLSANGIVRTTVQIVGAAAGPNIDVMSVGHAASKAFLTAKPRNEGVVLNVAGGRPVIERDTLVNPGDVVVGALDVRVSYGGPLSVTVLAVPPDADPAPYLYAPLLAPDGHQRHGTFGLADFAQRVIAYTVGGPDARYTYGSRSRTLANVAAGDAGRDYGDYGVVQRLSFDLDNPTAAPATVYLYEKPLGGDVRSSFAVNGALIDVGCVRVPRHYAVARYELAPHAAGVLDILTMTDGGSNYPLELGVTTTPPLMQTPPISAPDGCFPKPASPAAATQPPLRPGGR